MQIRKETFAFLKDIAKNNNREWFAENKPRYQEEHEAVKAFYQDIENRLNAHDSIEKTKLYRIYRDVRFSKDKTPYKSHFSGYFSRTGKALRGSYYLHIQPGASLLAIGFWGPNKEDLFRLRKEFEMDDAEIRDILAATDFQKHFGGALEGQELKTAPKGFDKTHPAIDLIRKKGFVAVKHFDDATVLSKTFAQEIDQSYQAARPFLDLMSDVLTTNLNGESLL